MEKAKLYAVCNFIVVLFVIFWNYWLNTGVINGNSVGDISNKYSNLFTPAGYAFAIWGVIFLGLLVLTINQLRLAFKEGEDTQTILQIGPWLSIANIGNALWLWLWLHEKTGQTVIVMFVILFSLIQIVLRTNMERWDAPLKIIAFVWWPICLYSGWIAVATIANFSAWLAKMDWSPFFSETQWTVIMIFVAGIVNLFMIYSRNMREFAGVGVWALIAIALRHWDEIPLIQWTAMLWAIVLIIAISVHGYKNRETNPLQKISKKSK